MLQLDRCCVYILMLGLALLIPSIVYITYLDELSAMLFGSIAILDCIFNNNWKKYKLLWIIMSIMTFYAIYSLFFLKFNIPIAIIKDWVIELKPFVPFIVVFAIGVKLTPADKKIISRICLFNGGILSVLFFFGTKIVNMVVFHPTYGGLIIIISVLFFLYCSIRPDGTIQKDNITISVVFLVCGLLCARSKYYAIFVLAIYFLFIYKPGMLKGFSFKHLLTLLVIITLIIAVSWHKIQYYFITGNSDSFDPEVVQSFARPVLYFTAFQIFIDFIPFGSGLASFASYPSSEFYSGVYGYYGIDKVYGIAPSDEFTFICDAYYPTLAQFGIIGIILFSWFWIYTYKYIKYLIKLKPALCRYEYIIGSLILSDMLIENVGATTFTQTSGMLCMILYGIIAAKGKSLFQHKHIIESNIHQKKKIII